MPSLLEVNDLNVSYRGADAKLRQAVAGVSFEIARGEVLGLMGESGSGKTSIALTLLGLLSDQQAQISGSVQFRGQELLSMNRRALRALRGAGISMVFQEPEIALNPVMRAGNQVAEVIHAHKAINWGNVAPKRKRRSLASGFPQRNGFFQRTHIN